MRHKSYEIHPYICIWKVNDDDFGWWVPFSMTVAGFIHSLVSPDGRFFLCFRVAVASRMDSVTAATSCLLEDRPRNHQQPVVDGTAETTGVVVCLLLCTDSAEAAAAAVKYRNG